MTDLMTADIPESYEKFQHNRNVFEETPEQIQMKEQMRNMWRYIEDPKEREKWKANWFFNMIDIVNLMINGITKYVIV
eukprot:UN06347